MAKKSNINMRIIKIVGILIILIVSLTITFYFLTHNTCYENFDSEKSGVSMISKAIEESKANNTFVCLLKPSANQIQIGKNIYQINECWMENSWHYVCENNKTKAQKDIYYNIVLNVESYDSLMHHNLLLKNHLRLNDEDACYCGGVIAWTINDSIIENGIELYNDTTIMQSIALSRY